MQGFPSSRDSSVGRSSHADGPRRLDAIGEAVSCRTGWKTAATIHMSHHFAVVLPEAHAIAAHRAGARDLHDEWRFITGLDDRYVEGSASVGKIVIRVVEQINDRFHLMQRRATRRVLDKAGNRKQSGGVGRMTQR